MPIPAVNTIIRDGALGILPESAEGVHVKLGVCASGTANQLYSFSDVQSAIDALGHGPLTEAVCQALTSATRGRAPRPVLAMKVTPSTAGTNSSVAVTRKSTSTGTLALAGAPFDAYSAIVLVTRTGTTGTAAFKYSLDGGDTYSAEIALAASYAVPNSGLTLNFTPNGGPIFFEAEDKFTFTSKAPEATTGDLATTFAALLADPSEWDFVHLVGAPQTGVDNAALATASAAIAAALDTHMTTALTAGRFVHCVMEAPDVSNDAAGDSALSTAFAGVVSARVSVVAGYDEVLSSVSGRIYRRPAGWTYAARLAAIRVAEMPSKVALGPLASITTLGRDERKREALDAQRFCTLRTHLGLRGFFVTSGRMLAAAGSDFDLVPNRRVLDKACRIGRAALLQYLDQDLRVNKSTVEGNPIPPGSPGAPGTLDERDARRIEAVVLAALEASLRPGDDDGDCSSVTVQVNRVEVLQTTRLLKVKIRVTPKGYARSIEQDIAFQAPTVAN